MKKEEWKWNAKCSSEYLSLIRNPFWGNNLCQIYPAHKFTEWLHLIKDLQHINLNYYIHISHWWRHLTFKESKTTYYNCLAQGDLCTWDHKTFWANQKNVYWIILSLKKSFNCLTDDSWAPNQCFRMISEGSCDTEDWKFSLAITWIYYILNYIKTVILNHNNISQYYSFTVFSDQINADLVTKREFFQKQKLLNHSIHKNILSLKKSVSLRYTYVFKWPLM